MIVAVRASSRESIMRYLAPFLILRRQEFVERLKWDLTVIKGLEIDQFDTQEAFYLLCIDPYSGLVGGMRFLPTTGPNMIQDVFPQYLHQGRESPQGSTIIESTRFFIANHYKAGGGACWYHEKASCRAFISID